MMLRGVCLLLALAALPPAAAAGTLTVNDVFRTAKVIVYELPDADGRAEAIRYIEGIRNRFFQGREIVDAATLDDAALREQLKGGFILYTTLSRKSKLLGPATAPLKWELADGRLKWVGLNLAVNGLRIVLVGKNSYGEGPCVVYAAGSNLLVAQANNVFHGPASYHIYDGETLVKDGLYDERFTSRERISRAEAMEDVAQFFSTLESVHPRLLARVSKADYAGLKLQVNEGVVRKLDGAGTIAVEDFAYLLSYAAAYFKDGHTSLRWHVAPTAANAGDRRFPPFLLDFDDGAFVIAAARNPALAGLELVAVNGAPVLEFLKPILDRCSAETLVYKATSLVDDQMFKFYMSNLFTGASSYKLTVRELAGHQRDIPIETLSFAEYRDFVMRSPLKRRDGGGTRVEFVDSGAIARFVYPSFDNSDAEKRKIDAIFAELKEKKTHDLIIDIRGNGGGDSRMGDYIFHFFQGPEKRAQALFTGRVYLLVDSHVFSSAIMFTTLFRDARAGKIMGSETGGLPAHFGEPRSFTLKNSGIPFSVSAKSFSSAKPQPGDDEHGIRPDIPLNRRVLAELKDERDPALAYAVKWVRGQR